MTATAACRPPVGPNLIASSTCRVLSVEDNTVRVASIDAFDGTPILSLKPHIPHLDSPSNVNLTRQRRALLAAERRQHVAHGVSRGLVASYRPQSREAAAAIGVLLSPLRGSTSFASS